MIPEVEMSLKYQTVCPKQGEDWIKLAEMLSEPLGSDDRETALAAIRNCDVCQIHFKRFLDGY